MVDRLPAPKLLENGVGKAEHQNVLNRFFAQVMVDAINLFFEGEPSQFGVELPGGGEVVAEWFFHHDALPVFSFPTFREACGCQVFHDFGKLAGRSG